MEDRIKAELSEEDIDMIREYGKKFVENIFGGARFFEVYINSVEEYQESRDIVKKAWYYGDKLNDLTDDEIERLIINDAVLTSKVDMYVPKSQEVINGIVGMLSNIDISKLGRVDRIFLAMINVHNEDLLKGCRDQIMYEKERRREVKWKAKMIAGKYKQLEYKPRKKYYYGNIPELGNNIEMYKDVILEFDPRDRRLIDLVEGRIDGDIFDIKDQVLLVVGAYYIGLQEIDDIISSMKKSYDEAMEMVRYGQEEIEERNENIDIERAWAVGEGGRYYFKNRKEFDRICNRILSLVIYEYDIDDEMGNRLVVNDEKLQKLVNETFKTASGLSKKAREQKRMKKTKAIKRVDNLDIRVSRFRNIYTYLIRELYDIGYEFLKKDAGIIRNYVKDMGVRQYMEFERTMIYMVLRFDELDKHYNNYWKFPSLRFLLSKHREIMMMGKEFILQVNGENINGGNNGYLQ